MGNKKTRIRRSFTEEFKRDAVRLVQDGRTVTAVARELGISRSLLVRWRDQLEGRNLPAPGAGTPAKSAEAEEIRRLRKELRDVTEERDILGKALVFFANEKK